MLDHTFRILNYTSRIHWLVSLFLRILLLLLFFVFVPFFHSFIPTQTKKEIVISNDHIDKWNYNGSSRRCFCDILIAHIPYCFYLVYFNFSLTKGSVITKIHYSYMGYICCCRYIEHESKLLTLISISSGNNSHCTYFTSSGHYGFRIAECFLYSCFFFLLRWFVCFFFVCLFEYSFVVFDMHLKCIMYIVRFTWNISLSIKSPTSVNFRLRLGSENSLKIGIHFDLFLFRLFWQPDFKLHWPIKIGETKKKHCAAQVFLWSVVHFMTTFSVQFFFFSPVFFSAAHKYPELVSHNYVETKLQSKALFLFWMCLQLQFGSLFLCMMLILIRVQ